MNENINLCEILKGHEGEIFWSDVFGLITLVEIYEDFISCHWTNAEVLNFHSNGSRIEGERCTLFPSKDQRDWNKWIEEQKPKVPKTWNELEKQPICDSYILGKGLGEVEFTKKGVTPIEKSALVLLKIHQLIEVGYGGNVTEEEWDKNYVCFVIRYDTMYKRFVIGRCVSNIQHIAFHTKEQAEEFLSKQENVQLLKDYFMI